MAQHDYNIANQSGADFRADLNNALLAIATVNSGSTEPSTTFAHQLWVDTSSSVLKIRNAADNAWITTGVSITASNTFTGNLTGNVTGNLTGNVTGNVTGDLTGNADSADTLSTARTISLSGDVVGSVSFDGSANVDIDTVVQINSITLGTDTTGDYVESMSGGTGVTVTGGTGEGSTPSIAIGQAVATTDDVTFNIITATEEFIGDLEGGIRFNAKADGALSKGDVVYISGVSGDLPTVGQAKADDASKMPAFGLALSDANDNAALQVVTFGTIEELDTSGVSEGQILYVSTTAGAYTTTAPTGESSQIQNIGKVIRSHAAAGSIKVGGAGRSNATPNLDNGKIFIGNGSNQSVTSTLDTSIVVENTNLYYTTARANTDFDTRLATKDTGDLTEGSNLYYTTARVNSDFDTRLATKSTTNLAEGTNLYYTSARFDSAFTSKDTDDLSEGLTNLYYTTARFDSAFGNKTTSNLTEGTNLYYTTTRANSAIDTRVTKAFVDALGIQATSVAANSVTLGTDTVGNYVATVTGTANKITVSGSGSESADITLSLPDDVQIADSLTVAGNLTVNGTLTSLDTTNLDIEDNLFQLNAGLTGSPVNDSGMLINRGNLDNGIFMWDESVDKFTLGLTTADGSATGNITLNSLGTLVANIEGNVTGTIQTAAQPNITSVGTLSALTVTGEITANGGIALGDGDKATFGASDDLQIYHDGSNSYIADTGTGGLRLLADADTAIRSANNTTTKAIFGGDVKLYHSGNLKLATTATGIDVTGTATMDGLTVDGSADGSIVNITKNGSDVGNIGVDNSDNLVIEGNSTHSGLQFSINSILPHKNGAVIDATIGLGNASAKFTDLHLSGTANVGGLTVDGNARIEELGAIAKLTLERGGSQNNADSAAVDLIETNAGSEGANFGDAATNGFRLKLDGSANDFLIQSGASGTVRTRLGIDRDTGDISFYEDTGTTAKFFWDASAERLGIGNTAPTSALDVTGTATMDGLTVDGNGVFSATSGDTLTLKKITGASLVFNNTTAATAAITAINGADGMDFRVGSAQAIKARLDASGNLLVGTTDASIETSSSGEGVVIKSDRVSASRTSGVSANFNRISSDGDIVNFRKDGTTVGSIGSASSGYSLYVQAGDVGLKMEPLADDIKPCTTNGASRDGAIDLGDSAARFKDLYLSGGAYLGGTAAANHLDDYEEGTWTPSYAFDVGGTGVVYGSQGGTYVKIGQTVYVSFILQVTSVLSASDYYLRLTGLPFNGSGVSQQRGRVWIQNPNSASFNLSVEGGTTSLLFYATNADADYARGDDVNGVRISGAFTYRAA